LLRTVPACSGRARNDDDSNKFFFEVKLQRIRLLLISLVYFHVVSPAVFPQDAEQSPPSESATPTTTDIKESEAAAVPPLITLGARIDALFSEGLPTQQGFSIPSVRLSADGEVSKTIDYHLWFGETREFSTALLPQIMPVEAAIEWLPFARFTWRVGMFTPFFDPWWTPDLSDLEIPDYSLVQSAVLLSRDIGTEMVYEIIPRYLTASIGAFNGNGILSLNTNSSRAFTASLRSSFNIVPEFIVSVGASAYTLSQSTLGAVNYRSTSIADCFMTLEFPALGFEVTGEVLGGAYQDSMNSTSPFGGVVLAFLDLTPSIKMFARGEVLNGNPNGDAYPLRQLQVGPIIKLDKALSAYIFYDYLEPGDGSSVSSGEIRLRLVI
jgi:hypothetical protein